MIGICTNKLAVVRLELLIKQAVNTIELEINSSAMVMVGVNLIMLCLEFTQRTIPLQKQCIQATLPLCDILSYLNNWSTWYASYMLYYKPVYDRIIWKPYSCHEILYIHEYVSNFAQRFSV